MEIGLIVLLFFLWGNQANAARLFYINMPSNYLTLGVGLIARWTFDGNTMYQNVADVSGAGNTGYLLGGATTTAPGKIGQALEFDGVANRVRLANDVLGTGNITLTAWMRPHSLGGNSIGRIVSNGETRLYLSAGPALSFSSDGGTTVAVSAASAYDFSGWTFVAVTRAAGANGVANIYVNGELSGSANQPSGTPITPTDVTRIGTDPTITDTFDGLLDQLRLYNRVLSVREIQNIYRIGAGATISTSQRRVSNGLVGWWTFDGNQVTASTATDASGNGHTGTLTDFGHLATTSIWVNTGVNTWTAPDGIVSVSAAVWGAGGGGGGMNVTSNGAGGGGGGAYSSSTVSVTPGLTYTMYVGAGGVGATGANTGATGQDSMFMSSTTIMAKGGTGGVTNAGTGGAGGDAAAGFGFDKHSGGWGEFGRVSTTGRGGWGGSSAGTAANGFNDGSSPVYSTNIYPTASTPVGGGHGGNGGGAATAGSPPAAGNYGGGGGGAGDGTNIKGGDGAGGKIILTGFTAANGWVSGRIGQALQLDGIGNYVNAGNVSSAVSTVSFWVRFSTSTTQNILALNNFQSISASSTVEANGFVSPVYYIDGVFAGSPAITDLGWHFVTVTTGTAINASAVNIGDIATKYFCGCTLDDVRLYTRVLSAAEIRQLYDAGTVKIKP